MQFDNDLSRYDLWDLGVKKVMENMMEDAGMEEIPDMSWDFPANGILSRTPNQNSDLHVEFDHYEDEWDDFNYEPMSTFEDYHKDDDTPIILSKHAVLAPATHAKEVGPSDTSPPFEHLHGESGLPGIFGSAIKNYGEAVCCCVVMSVDPTPIHVAFKNSWGLDDEEFSYVKTLIPASRSTGDAFWGGIGANLNPVCFAMPASQVAVKVKFHNKTRKSFGQNALVDWARLKAVAQAIAVQIVSDDAFAYKSVNRLDFMIDPREIPTAPTKLVLTDTNVPFSTYGTNQSVASQTIKFLRNGGMKPIREAKLEIGDTITVSTEYEVPMSLGTYMEIDVPQTVYAYGNLISEENFTMDIVERKRAPNLTNVKRDTVTLDNCLLSIAEARLSHGHLPDVRSFGVRKLLADLDLDSTEASDEAFRKLRHMCHDIFPPTVAINLVSFGNMLSMNGGRKFLANAARKMKRHRQIMQEHNVANIWAAITADRGGVEYLSEVIAKAMAKLDRVHEPKMTKYIRSMFVCGSSLEGPLNEVFGMRKRYWANRYYRSAKSTNDEERRVRWQVLSKLFMRIRFNIDKDGGVNFEDKGVNEALQDTLTKYVRKRLGPDDGDTSAPLYALDMVSIGVADDYVVDICGERPKPTFESIANKLKEGVEDFKDDVKKFMRQAMLQSPDLLVDDHTMYDLPEKDDTVWEYKEKEKVVAKPKFNMFAMDDFDMPFGKKKDEKPKKSMLDDDFFMPMVPMVNPNKNKLRLADELREDIHGIHAHFVEAAVKEYGKLVTVDEYNAIKEEVREKFIRDNFTTREGVDIE